MSEQEERRKEIDASDNWLALEKDIADILGVEFRMDQFFMDTLKGINFYQMEMLFREGEQIQPKTIVEIGSRAGCSSGILGALAKKHEGLCYCIDPNPHPQWAFNMERYNLQNHCIMINQASPWVPWDRQIDFLFVDGNHDMIPCLTDVYYWGRFVRKDGLIVIHDTMIRDGVKNAIQILEAVYPIEMIAKVEKGTGAIMYRKL